MIPKGFWDFFQHFNPTVFFYFWIFKGINHHASVLNSPFLEELVLSVSFPDRWAHPLHLQAHLHTYVFHIMSKQEEKGIQEYFAPLFKNVKKGFSYLKGVIKTACFWCLISLFSIRFKVMHTKLNVRFWQVLRIW